jgi:hypothetical protein
MPLTISHPAASVPLRRFGLALSPLVIGSMAPDFSKFAAMSPDCGFGHSWLGIFWFAVPSGLVVLWIFHTFIKRPLFALLPISHQKRLFPFLNRFSFKPAKQFRSVLFALWLGALTHLAWDAFTHKTNLTVHFLPALSTRAFTVGGYSMEIYDLLQIGSSLGGLALLMFWYFRWFKKTSEHEIDPQLLLSGKTKVRVVAAMIVFAMAVGIIYGAIAASQFGEKQVFKGFLARSIVTSGGVFAISLLAYCAIWHWKKRSSDFAQ